MDYDHWSSTVAIAKVLTR